MKVNFECYKFTVIKPFCNAKINPFCVHYPKSNSTIKYQLILKKRTEEKKNKLKLLIVVNDLRILHLYINILNI